MKERLLDVMKWGLILIIAGVVFYYLKDIDKPHQKVEPISNRYSLVGKGQEVAYKLDRQTGDIWVVMLSLKLLVKKRKGRKYLIG